MQSETFTEWLDLSATPIHSALSTRLLAITDVAEIAAVLDRGRVPQLAGAEFLVDVPVRTPVTRRIAKGAL